MTTSETHPQRSNAGGELKVISESVSRILLALVLEKMLIEDEDEHEEEDD